MSRFDELMVKTVDHLQEEERALLGWEVDEAYIAGEIDVAEHGRLSEAIAEMGS
jgi:hypothetical protein